MEDSPRHYPLHVQRELRRIGVDLDQLGGLAMAGGLSPTGFLGWLRTVPGGIGHEAFLRRLQADPSVGGPRARDSGTPDAPDVATFVDPETDEALAYGREFDRVVPPETVRGRNFGYDWPRGGRAQALEILRALPDGAGLAAFLAALQDTSANAR